MSETETTEATPMLDPKIQAAIAKHSESIQSLGQYAAKTVQDMNSTVRYASIGKRFVSDAKDRAASVGDKYNLGDYRKHASDVENVARLICPTRYDMDVYAQVYSFVELVKPLVPDVEKLSYFQITSKFLPMTTWDRVKLSGAIKEHWVEFLKVNVARQLSDDRLPIKELDALIAERTKDIAEAKVKAGIKKDPEKELAAQLKKESDAKRNAQNAARKSVSDAVAALVETGIGNGKEIASLMESSAEFHKIEIPKATVEVETGFNPQTATVDDAVKLVNAMAAFGKGQELSAMYRRIKELMTLTQESAKAAA